MTADPAPSSWSIYVADDPNGWWALPTNRGHVKDAKLVGKSLLPKNLVGTPPSLVITDGDATLYREEVIDALASLAGVGLQVSVLTSKAMHGEISFDESLRQRVALLEGLPVSALDSVLDSLTLTPGTHQLIDWAHSVGAKFGVVSGGFTQVLRPLVEALGVDFLAANHLGVAGGHLTGTISGPIVNAEGKVKALRRWSEKLDSAPEQAVTVGDGANDIPMLKAAGVGIAFCAKPAVYEAAHSYLSIAQLDAVTGLLGFA